MARMQVGIICPRSFAAQICCLSRLQNSLFFLSFFCRAVLEISMRDGGMCDSQVEPDERFSPIPLVIFTIVPDPLYYDSTFRPSRHKLKKLFCNLLSHEQYL